jgi:hypothetical protein
MLPNLGTTIVSTASYQRDMAWHGMAWHGKWGTLRYCGWRSGTTGSGREGPKSIMVELACADAELIPLPVQMRYAMNGGGSSATVGTFAASNCE